MTQDDMKNINSDSAAMDLLDRLRQSQSDQKAAPDSHNTDETEITSQNNEEPDIEEATAFENGKMPPEARRALVNLLKHGVILADQKGILFEAVVRYQSAIRSHLADMYLKLVLDERTGVAFIAQVDESDSDDTEVVSLITRRTLSLYDTLLLLVLRKHYQERESAGEQCIIIDIERIEASLTPFLPLTNSMKSDRRKLIAALKKMMEKRILSLLRGSGDRFEITAVIRYVVNAEFLEKMLHEYQRLAQQAGLSLSEHDSKQQDINMPEGDSE